MPPFPLQPPGPPIHHLDLYRLPDAASMQRLDLPQSFAAAVVLMEWPERLEAAQLPASRVDVHIEALSMVGRVFNGPCSPTYYGTRRGEGGILVDVLAVRVRVVWAAAAQMEAHAGGGAWGVGVSARGVVRAHCGWRLHTALHALQLRAFCPGGCRLM